MHSVFKNKEIEKTINEIASLGEILWQYGWAEKGAGNISFCISALLNKESFSSKEFAVVPLNKKYSQLANESFIITGSGKRMRDLSSNPLSNLGIIKINHDGSAYQYIVENNHSDSLVPSSELPAHLTIHEKIRQSVRHEKAVVHTHPTELIALTHIKEFQSEKKINSLLQSMHPESVVFVPKGLGLAPYCLPGSENIAHLTADKVEHFDVIMWERHGTFAIADTIMNAFDKIDILCKSAKIYFMVKQSGEEPTLLSEKQLDELLKTFVNK